MVIADDSVVVRGLFARWLGESGQFHLVAVAGDGETAVAHAGRFKPDVMVLDLDMPGVDGATALPQILRESPHTGVLLATTLNERSTRIALECMTKGAMDVVSKPDSRSGLTLSLEFRSEFLLKLGNVAQARAKPGALPVDVELDFIPGGNAGLRQLVSVVPRYLVIGASTGGPRAVARVLFDIGDALHDLTTVVVQHMPPVFTASFAEQISSYIGIPAREPFDGERLVRGTIYVAPGGRHLGIDRRLGHITASIDDGPPVRFCRPAVDPMLRSLIPIYKEKILSVILTGMGQDGMRGSVDIAQAGGRVLAQDEATSVVWGMPGATALAGICSAVL
ncbi:MAG: hypothetical protein B7Z14_01935, partial [Bosea sp. 32-68-6]